jgi:hypothetical protein
MPVRIAVAKSLISKGFRWICLDLKRSKDYRIGFRATASENNGPIAGGAECSLPNGRAFTM